MFNRANVLILLIALFGAGAGFFVGGIFEPSPQRAQPANIKTLAIGDVADELVLPDLQGRIRRLGEWKGKLLLINFWATWCAPCRAEMPLLDRARQEHEREGLEVLGIATDDADAVRAYLKTESIAYPILLAAYDQPDPSLRFGDVRSVLPFSVLIGRDGRVVAQRVGEFNETSLHNWLQPYL